ncbi:hypothetical protein [Kineococcus arenarius]|uniref:hypothetical protein n=1 Tax=Kineococcus sp. SYSU DK007 TaxID=3383128 RepID=UPI003D7CF59A
MSSTPTSRGTTVDRNWHLVLSTVVSEAEWRADVPAGLAALHAKLHQRARQQGLVVSRPPAEDVVVLPDVRRVRITVTAEAVPLRPAA